VASDNCHALLDGGSLMRAANAAAAAADAADADAATAAVKVDYRYEFGRLATASAPAPRHAGFTSFQHRCGLTHVAPRHVIHAQFQPLLLELHGLLDAASNTCPALRSGSSSCWRCARL